MVEKMNEQPAIIYASLRPGECCDRWKFYRGWLPQRIVAVAHTDMVKFNSTARNMRNRAMTKYESGRLNWEFWNSHLDDIYDINTSAKERQGREMNPAYFEYPKPKSPIENNCNHQYHLYAVWDETGKWVAYAIIHRMGEIANTSTIIGHADRLKDGIMYLLMDTIINTIPQDTHWLIYGEWDSGTKGLQYWKHATGFFPAHVTEKRNDRTTLS